MALIKCSECGVEVSDQADKCPKCACPISPVVDSEKAQVIEQTSKSLKGQLAISVIVVFLGFIMLPFYSGVGIFFLVGGLVAVIAIKVSIWWHHE